MNIKEFAAMKGIVLNGIKYKDNQDIVYLYTDLKGRKSFILNRKKKSNRLFPLSIIEFEPSGRQTLELQYLKDFSFSPVLPEIFSDIRKSTIAMFIGEFLYKVLKAEEPDNALFEYIQNSICMLDVLDEGVANFHLYFMVQLCKYMGFSILPNRNAYDYFDIKSGKFVFIEPLHPQFFNKENTAIFSELIELPNDSLNQLKISGEQRLSFANSMIDFYSYRFDHAMHLKSLYILHEIFL